MTTSQTLTPTAQDRFHEDAQFRSELRKLSLRDDVWEALVATYRDREKSGLSQADWATAAGKSAAAISRLMKKPTNLTLDSVAELLSALDAYMAVSIVDCRNTARGNGHQHSPISVARGAWPNASVQISGARLVTAHS